MENPEQEKPAPKPVLNLSTQIARDQVIIDGTSYGILNREELSMLELHAFQAKGRKLVAIGSKAEATEEEIRELTLVLDALCRELLPDVPHEVHGKLKDGQRMAIAEAFLKIAQEG